MTLALGLMIGGGIVAVFGVGMLLTRMGTLRLLGGIVLAVIGLGSIGVGYTLDQFSDVTYSVMEVAPVSARDHEDHYRVTLKDKNGIDFWIYVNSNQSAVFKVGEEVTMTKGQLKSLQNQDA